MIEDDRLARSSETRDPPPMHAHPNECTAPFIDGGSLSAIARAVGFHVDHRRLISAFRQKGDLVRAIYYTALAEGERCAFVRRLLNWLACSGFSIATKPAKADVDPPTTPELRGCASIELTIDVLRLANNLDHLNRCLRRRRPALQRKGKRVSVVSTLQAQLTSDDLRVRVTNSSISRTSRSASNASRQSGRSTTAEAKKDCVHNLVRCSAVDRAALALVSLLYRHRPLDGSISMCHPRGCRLHVMPTCPSYAALFMM